MESNTLKACKDQENRQETGEQPTPAPEPEQQAIRGADGRFLKGMSGNPSGRPRGATNAALKLVRAWTLAKGLPMLIELAEAGNLDAIKILVQTGLPRQKPVTPPIEGLDGLPEARKENLDEMARELFARVCRAELSKEDAANVLSLANQIVSSRDWREVEKKQSVLFPDMYA